MRSRQHFALALLLCCLMPAAAAAQWATNGNAVSTAAGAQDHVRIAANNLGGAVMVWQDNRGTTTDIYARSIGITGAGEWTANGIPLCTAAGHQTNPQVAYDGTGQLLYTWEDSRTGTPNIYAASTDRWGNIMSSPNGFAISTSSAVQQYSALTTNPIFGVGYVVWTDSRNGNNDIYGQAFNYVGTTFWTGGGLPFCTDGNVQIFPAVAPGGGGGGDGAIVVWQDFRNGNYDIYAQSANLSNQLSWGANGVPVCTHSGAQLNPMIVPDGAGGAIVAWQDQRNGVSIGSIYARRINSAGVLQWANDVAVVVSTDRIGLPRMISDGAGGAILAWEDDRNLSTNGDDIYAQRISGSGAVLWTANGVPVCTAPFAQNSCDIGSDGSNGVVVTWQDGRTLSSLDVYAQRVDSAGSLIWAANGIPISTGTGNQFNVAITRSDAGGNIVAWEDRRNANVADVYAERIDTGTGFIGHPQPYISSIVDVPNDQGGAVRITLQPGDGVDPGEFEIYDYEYHGTDVVYVGTWDGSPSYTMDVLTEGVGVPNHYFVLASAHGVGFESNVAEGTSIDNLAPPAPTLSAQRNGANVSLSWNSTASDIQNYTVTRTDVGTLATVTTTSYTDLNTPHAALHYRVHATDIHGNVGPESNEVVLPNPTGVENVSVGPSALTLLPNSPNPFRATSAFRFGMPRAGRVQLEVFDAAGRRVASRDLGEMSSGWRELVLDGRDDAGHLLGSGVYFYRVNALGETRASKMVIQR